MEPKTLHDAIKFFDKPENVRAYMIARRWPDGIVRCPQCGSDKVKFSEKHNRWQCAAHHAKRQFTLKTSTIFEDSPLGLDKWLMALWMLVNCKNGVSSWEIHRTVGVTQKTAWFMLHRLRNVFTPTATAKAGGNGGEVESDETFVGGKTRNMHKSKLKRLREAQKLAVIPSENPYVGKTPVIGILDRETRQIRARVLPNMKRETLQNQILNNVEYGAKLYTDSAVGYKDAFVDKFAHEVVNHTKEYVRGRVHTNGMENFWSLFKRTLHGTYVAVEPFHLDRYVDEQVFRFNNRATKENKLTDADRFDYAVSQIAGRRLTYKELTGKVGVSEAF